MAEGIYPIRDEHVQVHGYLGRKTGRGFHT